MDFTFRTDVFRQTEAATRNQGDFPKVRWAHRCPDCSEPCDCAAGQTARYACLCCAEDLAREDVDDDVIIFDEEDEEQHD